MGELGELEALGFKPFFRSQLAALGDDATPARVAVEQRGRYQLLGCDVTSAAVAPALARRAKNRIELPAVGDWVAVRGAGDEARITEVFERATCFVRKAAGRRNEPQVIAANVDVVAVVSALTEDADYSARARRSANPRRVERYLVAVRQAGAQPVIVINKADVCPDPSAVLAQLGSAARGVPLLVTSATSGDGLDALMEYVGPGDTLAFVGSSGVGKSTLINRLMGHVVEDTSEQRGADERGRHTTTHRQLHMLSGGAVLLDTPGMREFALWGGDDAEDASLEVFDEIAALTEQCHYRDCSHHDEPGCAVLRAVEAGDLEQARVDSFLRLEHEMSTSRKDAREAKRKWAKDIALHVRRLKKLR
jgi:ribosome biogenesis GTPase